MEQLRHPEVPEARVAETLAEGADRLAPNLVVEPSGVLALVRNFGRRLHLVLAVWVEPKLHVPSPGVSSHRLPEACLERSYSSLQTPKVRLSIRLPAEVFGVLVPGLSRRK